MGDAINCCICEFLEKDDSETFSVNKIHHKIKDFTQDEVELLHLRVPGLQTTDDGSICHKHYKRILLYYSSYEKKCIDPWNKHSKTVTSNLKEVSLNLSKSSSNVCNINIIPGQKLCKNCYSKVNDEIESCQNQYMHCSDPFEKHRIKNFDDLNYLDHEAIEHLKTFYDKNFTSQHKICTTCNIRIKSEILESKMQVGSVSALSDDNKESPCSTINPNLFTENTPTSEFCTDSQKRRNLEIMLDTFNVQPFKRKKMNDNLVKKNSIDIIQNVTKQVSEAFEDVYDITLTEFKNLKEMHDESLWFRNMISDIQKKFTTSTFNEKISLLTFLPSEWSFQKVTEYLKCTYYMFTEARKLRLTGQRRKKIFFRIPLDVREDIVNYYLNDSNSINCSGIKECVTVKVPGQPSTSVQKRILIYDLKDLYQNWIKETKYDIIPCLPYFSQLRPKECVFAGDPGTHNICVCLLHQNVKLKLGSMKVNESYKELVEAGVCSIGNKDCMLHKCGECQKQDGIRKLLCTTNIHQSVRIKYSNWTSTPISTKNSEGSSSTRVILQDFEKPFEELIDDVCNDIWAITEHHFISYKQKDSFASFRQNLCSDTGLVVMDFAENYTFICQNSTQGFYFNNTHASLFTVSLYYTSQSNSDLKVASFCVISDSTKHQAYSVHIFQEVVINEIKIKYPWIKRLIYFSDGAPTQFKNKNHFINLCHHEEDFGIKIISYNFFATSHGKSACDGIGAVAKRTVRKASLQGVTILTPEQMYTYLNDNVKGVRFLYVSENSVEARGKLLKTRFASAKTVKNTRLYHCVEIIDKQKIRAKIFSDDTESYIINL